MDSRVSDEQLSAYLDGELTGAEQALVERSLASDAALRRRLEALQRVGTLVQRLPVDPPQRDFRSSVVAQLRVEAAPVDRRGPHDPPAPLDDPSPSPTGWNAAVPLGIGLLVTAALVLVILNVVHLRDRQGGVVARRDDTSEPQAEPKLEQQTAEAFQKNQAQMAQQMAGTADQMRQAPSGPAIPRAATSRPVPPQRRRSVAPQRAGELDRPRDESPQAMEVMPEAAPGMEGPPSGMVGGQGPPAPRDPVERIVELGVRVGRVVLTIAPEEDRREGRDKPARDEVPEVAGGGAEPLGANAPSFGRPSKSPRSASRMMRLRWATPVDARLKEKQQDRERDKRTDGKNRPSVDGRAWPAGPLVVRGSADDVRRELRQLFTRMARGRPLRIDVTSGAVIAAGKGGAGGGRRAASGRASVPRPHEKDAKGEADRLPVEVRVEVVVERDAKGADR